MSFYDDSTLLFLAAGAVYKDGKINTIKPAAPNTRAPLLVTRGSNLTATRVDSNGLIEKGRENLFTYSNDFSNTWINVGSTEASGQSGYDGSNDAWELTKVGNAEGYIKYESHSVSGVNTISIYTKESSSSWIYIFADTIGGYYFDLRPSTTGNRVGTEVLTGTIDGSAFVEDIGNNWFRVGFSWNGSNSRIRITPAEGDGQRTDTSGSIYIQDAQLEQGLVATEYIESGATTGKAGLLENEPRFNYPIGGGSPHLLLEPSRTNLIGQSEYIDNGSLITAITAINNDTQSPEGLVNATRFRLGVDESATRHRKLFVLSATSGEDYSFSVFFKEADAQWIQLLAQTTNGVFDIQSYVNFDLQNGVKGNVGTSVVDSGIEDYGNGWYRCYMVATAQATATGYLEILTTNNTDSGRYPSYENTTAINYCYVYGAQIEQASYPTSYIPNHSGGSVSRESEEVQTADVSSLNLIGQNEGTFFLDYEFLDGQTAENQNWIALESENNQEKVLIYKSPSNSKIQVYHVANNSLVFNYNTNVTIVPNTRYKVAFKYSSGDIAVAINGSLIVTNSSTYTRGSDLSRVIFNESNIQPSCRLHQTIVLTSGWDNLDLAILTGLTDYYASFSEMATALNYTIYE